MPDEQCRVLDYNFVFDDTVGLSGLSQDAEFPASNLRSHLRSKVYRSSGYFKVTAGSNDKINFKESSGGAEKTATLNPGPYTPAQLATEIGTRMTAAGTKTYTCTYSGVTGRFTISTSGTYLAILFSTGTDAATSCRAVIGFGTADFTIATSYTGPSIAIHTEERLTIDLKTTDAIDSLAIIFDRRFGSKLTNAATIKLQASATQVWTAPSVDVTLAYDSDYDVITHFFTASQSYRYWSIQIVDPANPRLYVEIPKVFLTKATQLSQVPQLGFNLKAKDQSKNNESPYGVRYTDIYPMRRSFKFDYGFLPAADLKSLEQIFERVGSVTPICLALDALENTFDKDRYFIMGYLKNEQDIIHKFTSNFDTNLTIEEAL